MAGARAGDRGAALWSGSPAEIDWAIQEQSFGGVIDGSKSDKGI